MNDLSMESTIQDDDMLYNQFRFVSSENRHSQNLMYANCYGIIQVLSVRDTLRIRCVFRMFSSVNGSLLNE